MRDIQAQMREVYARIERNQRGIEGMIKDKESGKVMYIVP